MRSLKNRKQDYRYKHSVKNIVLVWYHFWRKYFKYGGFKRYGLLWVLKGQAGIDRIRSNFRTLQTKEIMIKRYGSQNKGARIRTRKALILRDGSICQSCKDHFYADALTIDHIVKVIDGGSRELHNLQLLCVKCHREKDNQKSKRKLIRSQFFPFKEALDNWNNKHESRT